MTAYDQPGDPIADLRAAVDRINAAARPAAPEPLEFPVPALADLVVHRAGPDVALDDQARYQAHALTVPPAGWSCGWVAHPDTLAGMFHSGRPGAVWAPPGLGMLTDHPVWTSGAAPASVLVPVHVRHGDGREPS